MTVLARPNPAIVQAAKAGQSGYGMPKSNSVRITAGNAEKYASEVIRILQEFLFFEQNYCSLVFLGEP
jgi:hypothetical protein